MGEGYMGKRVFNNFSGGVCSTAMALLNRKIPNVLVNTGGNYPEVWETVRQLKRRRIKIIVLGSPNKNYPTYYDYIAAENLKPFFKSCSDKAKQRHLDAFYRIVGPCIVNIGYVAGEENRVARFKNTPEITYNFPMLPFTREDCSNILRRFDVEACKSGCWFCPKQPKSSWEILRRTHPDKYEEALKRGWCDG